MELSTNLDIEPDCAPPTAAQAVDDLARANELIEGLPKNAARANLDPIIHHLSRADDEIGVAMALKAIVNHASFKGMTRDIKNAINKARAKHSEEAAERAFCAQKADEDGDAISHVGGASAEPAAAQENTKPKNKVDYGPLNYLNNGYAVAQFADKVVILQPARAVGKRGSELIYEPVRFLTEAGFRLKYANLMFTDGNNVTGPATEKWLESKYRKTYSAVVCEPYGLGERDPTASGVFNLFSGYAVTGKPLPGASCQLFLDHLRENVCGGNVQYYEWLVSWFAQMLRHPCDKPGTAVVLRGLRGTGKSKVGEVISRLYHPWNAVSVSKPGDIVGDFPILNGTIVFAVAEEALFAGNHSHEGPLKDLITSKTMVVSIKHVNKFQARNCVHLLMSTNSDWSVPSGDADDERRFFVLDVSAAHKDDHPYFAAIDAQLADGGLEALARFLLDWEKPAHVNLRKPPITEGLREQAQFSEAPTTRCLRAMLSTGGIQVDKDTLLPIWDASELADEQKRGSGLGGFSFAGDGVVAGDGVMLVPKELMRQAFVYFARQNNLRAGDMTDVAVGRALKKIGVVTTRKKQGKDGVEGNTRYYALPPFEVLCAAFETKFGGL